MTPDEAIRHLREIREYHYISFLSESVPNGYSAISPKSARWHKQYYEYLDGVIDLLKTYA